MRQRTLHENLNKLPMALRGIGLKVILSFALIALPSLPIHALAEFGNFKACVRFLSDRYLAADSAAKVYRFSISPLGKGVAGNVFAGKVPKNPDEFVTTGMKVARLNWPPGTPVAVKIPTETADALKILKHEAAMLSIIAPFDPLGLFVRGFFDQQRDCLVLERRIGEVTLTDWVQSRRSRREMELVAHQLVEALAELAQAGLVHSDLKPRNILIHPKTLKIRIIDFGVTAFIGGYPFVNLTDRGGTPSYKSREQAAGRPASTADDEFAIKKVIESLLRAQED